MEYIVNTRRSRLNVREKPGSNYPVIGTLQRGARVKVVKGSDKGAWKRLAAGGWVHGDYLKPATGGGSAPPPGPPAGRTSEETDSLSSNPADWIPLPSLAFTATGWYPSTGKLTRFNWDFRFGVEFQVKVEGPRTLLEVNYNFNESAWESKLKYDLSSELEASFSLVNISQLVNGRTLSSPRAFATEVVKRAEIKRKFSVFGQEVWRGMSYYPQAPFCIFFVEVPLFQSQLPSRDATWEVPGSNINVRLTGSGKLIIRFGPNARGWLQIARAGIRGVRFLRTVIRQIPTLGRYLKPIFTSANMAWAIYGLIGVVGAVAFTGLTVVFLDRQRRLGRESGELTYFCTSYVLKAWEMRREGESGRERSRHPMAQEGRRAAEEDIRRFGGGSEGARILRLWLSEELDLDWVHVERPLRGEVRTVATHLHRYLERGSTRRRTIVH